MIIRWWHIRWFMWNTRETCGTNPSFTHLYSCILYCNLILDSSSTGLFEMSTDGWLLSVVKSARPKQTLPSSCGGSLVLYWTAQVPYVGPARGPLSASTDLHEQAGREAVLGASATSSQQRLLIPFRYQSEDLRPQQ